ncbi:YdeI/OmpD-associated family protein [Chitinophaga sancti]|uniref:DUF1801 domain-containing protein n=1 Tax=Chitinophaga sancti TaxID=1004 RepID=A0A1K1RPW3_9BACT|nr:DUF1801 domain-containing protein [Chitinophaga sancti]WQD62534.1 DUF1801 domain-containing protein [Chitinophaga sancti]WQG91897.1 DUF1801 domain-containing protein [Chitinophaga sancti]SFW74086.1 Uncharacterized conserved protein YdeI, YjbR/CyaY-like superfamily, DUF1801 family [Chitinophaga sancti]
MAPINTPDEFFAHLSQWKDELLTLRTILLKTGLEETFKWGKPTYTSNGKNIVGISDFKSYCGLWFFQGALLEDKAKVLINAQEGTKAMRSMRFASIKEIDEKLIKAYVAEAVANEASGIKITADKNKPLIIPEELQNLLDTYPTLKEKFAAFNKTNQRDFAEYIATAKQEKTRQTRLEKVHTYIEQGIGLHDKYK